MSTVEQTASSPGQETFRGILHGRTIELEHEPSLPDGQHVSVRLDPVAASPQNWPPDVAAFAKEQHVEEFLPKVLELTQRVFPSAAGLNVVVTEDPEIADDKHIVFEVQAVGLDVPQAVASEMRWCREIFDFCPAPLVCVFRLGMRLSD